MGFISLFNFVRLQSLSSIRFLPIRSFSAQSYIGTANGQAAGHLIWIWRRLWDVRNRSPISLDGVACRCNLFLAAALSRILPAPGPKVRHGPEPPHPFSREWSQTVTDSGEDRGQPPAPVNATRSCKATGTSARNDHSKSCSQNASERRSRRNWVWRTAEPIRRSQSVLWAFRGCSSAPPRLHRRVGLWSDHGPRRSAKLTHPRSRKLTHRRMSVHAHERHLPRIFRERSRRGS